MHVTYVSCVLGMFHVEQKRIPYTPENVGDLKGTDSVTCPELHTDVCLLESQFLA